MAKKNKKIPEFQDLYGFHSVFSALQNSKREHFKIFILEKFKDFVKKILTKNRKYRHFNK